jgi:hypothetical protein
MNELGKEGRKGEKDGLTTDGQEEHGFGKGKDGI